MVQVRRSRYLFLRLEDGGLLDLGRLLAGELAVTSAPEIRALSVLTGHEYPLEPAELETLANVPAERWTSLGETADVLDLAAKGLLVSDAPEGRLAELRRREERLEASGWGRRAALFHFLDVWRDVDVLVPDAAESVPPAEIEEALADIVSERGVPPSHFHSVPESGGIVELPLVATEGALFQALHLRRTTRTFDESRSVSLEDFSALLYETFGCHAYSRVSPGLLTLRKTSPSGGGLHPIEAYALVVGVEGVEPGLYHYDAAAHALHRLAALEREDALALTVEFTAGQKYLRGAHALFVLAARFERSFWKYRELDRAYAVLLLDAGHLSQTLYLVCTALGLGAFVTAAVNGANISDALGLDENEQGVLAVCGCGVPARQAPYMEADPVPYVPRETLL